MKMIRTIYRIDGKDYEESARCTLTLNVLAVSIQNFLGLAKECHCFVEWHGQIYTDSQRTNTNGDMKSIRLFAHSPKYIVALAKRLGKNDWDTLNNNWNIRNHELRYCNYKTKPRYIGVLCFDPATKQSKLVSNSPIKLINRQHIFNGKLWRRYYGPDMR